MKRQIRVHERILAQHRETLEETELRVCATGVIGSRVHPLTGVPIAYVTATPASELDVIGGRARSE